LPIGPQQAQEGKLLLIAHTDDGEIVRIIGAREPTLENVRTMDEVNIKKEDDDMRSEYDLSKLKGRFRGNMLTDTEQAQIWFCWSQTCKQRFLTPRPLTRRCEC